MVMLDGAKLRKIRKAMRKTQAELAEAANITERYLRELEAGRKTAPSASIVFDLANVLGIPMEELMTTRKEAI